MGHDMTCHEINPLMHVKAGMVKDPRMHVIDAEALGGIVGQGNSPCLQATCKTLPWG
jgi:hypothetical protein